LILDGFRLNGRNPDIVKVAVARRINSSADPHRDQCRCVRDGPKCVGFLAPKVNQIARPKRLGGFRCAELDPSLDALDRDFTRRLVFSHLVAGEQHNAHDFQFLGLENGGRLRVLEMLTQRPNADHLSRLGVCLCHGNPPLNGNEPQQLQMVRLVDDAPSIPLRPGLSRLAH
jgi:hypothetical protein